MTTHAYLFEAKSIQAYILATNRLKEMIGASELIESLTDKLLTDVVKTIGGTTKIEFSRRGGGAFYAFSSDTQIIEKLATLWPLVVRHYAPDLEFVQARGQGDNHYAAFNTTQPLLLAARNAPLARLPQAPPSAVRNRRTGEPAVDWYIRRGHEPEPVDAPTMRKLDSKFWRGLALGKRFAPNDPWQAWPLNLTPDEDDADDERNFPFIGEDHTLALVHADGNGLGQLLIKLGDVVKTQPEQYVKIFSAFSKAVTEATQQAAQTATREILKPQQIDDVYPARPIVLGGDDLTILIRSDLALDFTRSFLTHFANASGTRLQALKQQFNLPELPNRLTACAGIAYAKSSQPLYLLHGLAENLCTHAKTKSKAQDKDNVPTSLSFHRVTTSFVDDYAIILERELTFDGLEHELTSDGLKRKYNRLRQTLECYALEPEQGLPRLDDLLALRNLLYSRDFSKNASRELLGLVGKDPAHAPRHYQRWREVMKERAPTKLHKFDELLFNLGITQASGDLPYSGSATSLLRHTPLGDVIMLQAAGDTCKVATTTTAKANPCS